MRVHGVLGSPRPGGRTAAATRAVLAGAEAQGCEVEAIDLAPNPPLEEVLAFCQTADAVVFGSPVYRAGMATPLKRLLDQLPRGMWGETSAPLQGKAAAVVLTGASDHHYLAVDEPRRVLAGFFACQVLSPGLYLAPDSFTEGNGLTETAADLTALHGAAFVELARAVHDSKFLQALRPQV